MMIAALVMSLGLLIGTIPNTMNGKSSSSATLDLKTTNYNFLIAGCFLYIEDNVPEEKLINSQLNST